MRIFALPGACGEYEREGRAIAGAAAKKKGRSEERPFDVCDLSLGLHHVHAAHAAARHVRVAF